LWTKRGHSWSLCLNFRVYKTVWLLEASCWIKIDWNNLSIHSSFTLVKLQYFRCLLAQKCKYWALCLLWMCFLQIWALRHFHLWVTICEKKLIDWASLFKLTVNITLYSVLFLLADDKSSWNIPRNILNQWTSWNFWCYLHDLPLWQCSHRSLLLGLRSLFIFALHLLAPNTPSALECLFAKYKNYLITKYVECWNSVNFMFSWKMLLRYS
jgi:hypothetical protein